MTIIPFRNVTPSLITGGLASSSDSADDQNYTQHLAKLFDESDMLIGDFGHLNDDTVQGFPPPPADVNSCPEPSNMFALQDDPWIQYFSSCFEGEKGSQLTATVTDSMVHLGDGGFGDNSKGPDEALLDMDGVIDNSGKYREFRVEQLVEVDDLGNRKHKQFLVNSRNFTASDSTHRQESRVIDSFSIKSLRGKLG
jgi:hypothetical protein